MPAKSIRKWLSTKACEPSGGGALPTYARIAKGDNQKNTLQTKARRAAGWCRLFEGAAFGGRRGRLELHPLPGHPRKGDTVVVWKLDRLSRSLKDVLHIMERTGNAGAGFRSITENINITTLAGRMTMQMVGAVAEFERAMIRQRTSSGLAATSAAGRSDVRRRKPDAAKRREIAESVMAGCKPGAGLARPRSPGEPTVSLIVAEARSAARPL